MRINKALNLVIPIDYEKGGQIFVHSTPISRDVFEQYFLVISKTFAAIFSQGLGALAGPRIAYLMLKQTAEDLGVWEGDTGVRKGLMNEIIRLTNVAIPGDQGWKTLPLYNAISKEIIDSETLAEIEGEIIFFTCVSMMNKRAQIEGIMETVNGLWNSQTTSLDFMEYTTSLKTSTEEENTGATETISSVAA